jgi:hypothetical protein
MRPFMARKQRRRENSIAAVATPEQRREKDTAGMKTTLIATEIVAAAHVTPYTPKSGAQPARGESISA